MKKIIVVTGSRASGKTTALARFPRPSELSKMMFIDTEDSASDIIESNKAMKVDFGEYVRAYERFKPNGNMLDLIAKGNLPWVSAQQRSALQNYYDWFIEMLNQKLEQDKFKFLAIDTIEPIEAAMTAWVESNRQKSGWSGNKAFGRLETEGVRPLYENLLEAIARRGVEYILLSSHLKRVWENDKPILNKLEPGGRIVVLSRLSSRMFWLVPEPSNADGAPAAIVLKARKASESISKNEWITKRPLPRRIPHFTRADLERYEAQGCDLINPKVGETITPAEQEMISEFLTDEQMRLMVLGAEMDARKMAAEGVVTMNESITDATQGEPVYNTDLADWLEKNKSKNAQVPLLERLRHERNASNTSSSAK